MSAGVQSGTVRGASILKEWEYGGIPLFRLRVPGNPARRIALTGTRPIRWAVPATGAIRSEEMRADRPLRRAPQTGSGKACLETGRVVAAIAEPARAEASRVVDAGRMTRRANDLQTRSRKRLERIPDAF